MQDIDAFWLRSPGTRRSQGWTWKASAKCSSPICWLNNRCPSIFTASRRRNPKSRPCALSQNGLAQFRVTLQLTPSRVTGVSRALKNSASRLFKKVQMRGARENRRAESYLPIRCSEAIETCMRDVGSHCECSGTMVQIKAVVQRSHSNERGNVCTPGV